MNYLKIVVCPNKYKGIKKPVNWSTKVAKPSLNKSYSLPNSQKTDSFCRLYPSAIKPRKLLLDKFANFNKSVYINPFAIKKETCDELIESLPLEIKGKEDVSEISMKAKRSLLRVVSVANTELFDKQVPNLNLLPKNREEYCALMQNLAKSVQINVLPVSKQKLVNYYSAMSKLESILPSVDVTSLNIGLKMPRNVFVNQSLEVIKDCSEVEKRKVFDYFGFEFIDEKLFGYPVNDSSKPISQDASAKVKDSINKLRGVVDSFTQNNRIVLGDNQKPLEDALNDICCVLPEFYTAVGKQQHGTHKYTLDIHMLKVLQESMRNPEYKNLSQKEKKMFNIAVFLHDISKAESIVDRVHPYESAMDISCILQKMDFSFEDQQRIVKMVKNHHWLELISQSTVEDTEILKTLAFYYRKPNDFLIAKIFAESDLRGVSDEFFEKCKGALVSEPMKLVEKYVSDFYQTGLYFPQSSIPKASLMGLKPMSISNGVDATKNVVVDLSKHPNLRLLGFDNSKLQAFLKEFKSVDEGVKILNGLSTSFDDVVLSSDYLDGNKLAMKYNNKIGVLLASEQSNILTSVSSEQSDSASFINKIFGDKKAVNKETESRREFASKLKERLKISDEEYAILYKKMASSSLLGVKVRAQLKSIIHDIVKSFLEKSNVRKEVEILNPELKAIWAKDVSLNAIPYSIRKFAQDNDLPIIIFK